MNAIFLPGARGRGFSLVEMSVALAIAGVLAFALWKILPQIRTIDDARPVEAQIALADEAILGFVLKNHRLPCPDTNGDGREDASAPSGPCAAARGGFPFHTLGLSLPSRLHYGAYQDGSEKSLTSARPRHAPMLPPAPAVTGTEWPLTGGALSYTPGGLPNIDGIPDDYAPAFPEATAIKDLSSLKEVVFERQVPDSAAVAAQIHGLDFCAALREAQSGSSPVLTSNGVTVAYVIAHPGAGDADGDGSFLDGLNDGATAAFEPPDRASSNVYDDQVLAVGFGELAARLSCAALLSRANAAGHAARASYDHYLFALAHLQARAFLLDMAYLDLQLAYASLVFAIVNVADGAATVIMTTAAGIMTTDEAMGGVLLGIGAALGATTLVLAGIDLDSAIEGMPDAVAATEEAIAARIEAEIHARKMLAAADETARYAVQLDTKGLLP
ncbi:MAG: type II secretion system GspH family protein [Candidatus Accumulibacter sp.]|jgi:prepilin-type N-terminal cleavage/methylation domain-containing protein|nr:type II secretion system GspH family protein [Accumulibacter sp.]